MLHDDTKSLNEYHVRNIFLSSMISGAFAGTICDLVFFPIDTLKTRLQSQHGFMKSGGFTRLYQGIIPVMVGSAPSASIFFITYEGIKEFLQPNFSYKYHWMVHMGAAATGEMAACLIRVPVEVIKQRRQALLKDKVSSLGLKTLYRGYGTTVLRDMPFGFTQMPLWEYFKFRYKQYMKRECTPLEGAICGAVSVAISATVTTPLDVAKTRIMLASTNANKAEVKITSMFREIYRQNGVRGLFAGFYPRVCGYTVGAILFFGIYEQSKQSCQTIFPYTTSSQ